MDQERVSLLWGRDQCRLANWGLAISRILVQSRVKGRVTDVLEGPGVVLLVKALAPVRDRFLGALLVKALARVQVPVVIRGRGLVPAAGTVREAAAVLGKVPAAGTAHCLR